MLEPYMLCPACLCRKSEFTKVAQRRNTITVLRTIPGSLVLNAATNLREIPTRSTPTGAPNAGAIGYIPKTAQDRCKVST